MQCETVVTQFRNFPIGREKTCECGVLLKCPTCYMLTEHSHCSIRNILGVMTVVGSRRLPAKGLHHRFVVAEISPNGTSETDALPKINCPTLMQQRLNLLVVASAYKTISILAIHICMYTLLCLNHPCVRGSMSGA